MFSQYNLAKMVTKQVSLKRLSELSLNGWNISKLQIEFLHEYLFNAIDVRCTSVALSTLDKFDNIQTYKDQPSIIFKSGFSQWANRGKITRTRSCGGFFY